LNTNLPIASNAAQATGGTVENPAALSLDGTVLAEICCADCGTTAPGNYCPACGQETKIETPTVRHFLHEFIDQYIAVEGKLGRTLRTLIVQPGQLTKDYVEGRRQRYVRPLKLYLTISLIFFTLLGVLPDARNPFIEISDGAHDIATDVHHDIKRDAEKHIAKPAPEVPPADGSSPPPPDAAAGGGEDEASAFEKKLEEKADAFTKLDAGERTKLLRKNLADDAPYAMFFLLPYFALLLKWTYRKQRQRYGVHLLFSLHLHTFLFVALALGFLPLPALLRRGIEVAIAIYVFAALRRVYGGGAGATIWRMVWLWMFYIIALGLSAFSGVLTVIFGGDAST